MPRSKLVGMNFRPMEAQVVALALVAGQPVVLEAEPMNKYDPNAIKVLSDDAEGLFLGYVIARDKMAEDLVLASDIADKLDSIVATVLSNGKTKDTIYLDLEISEEVEAPAAA